MLTCSWVSGKGHLPPRQRPGPTHPTTPAARKGRACHQVKTSACESHLETFHDVPCQPGPVLRKAWRMDPVVETWGLVVVGGAILAFYRIVSLVEAAAPSRRRGRTPAAPRRRRASTWCLAVVGLGAGADRRAAAVPQTPRAASVWPATRPHEDGDQRPVLRHTRDVAPRGWDSPFPVGRYWRAALVVFFNYGGDTEAVWKSDPFP